MAASQAGPSSRTPLLQAHHASRQPRPLVPGQSQGQGHAYSHAPASARIPYTSNTADIEPELGPPSHHTSRAASPYPSTSTRPLKRRRRRTPPLPVLPTLVLLTCTALLVFAAWDVSSIGNCYFPSICKALGKGKERKDEVYQRNTGAYAPYVPQGAGGGRVNLPRGCEINQVNALHRHAARFPTSSSGSTLRAILHKLQHRHTGTISKRHPELHFIEKADLNMTEWRSDDLTDQGRKAAWKSGKEAAALYNRLRNTGEGVFYRAGGSGRVVETGQYWKYGFEGHAFRMMNTDGLPKMDVVIPEDESSNNTLSVHSCAAFEAVDDAESLSNPRYATLLSLLTPALNRLNAALRPSPPLDLQDLPPLADMCAFDAQARGTEWKGWSEWCGIFRAKEWEVLGYLRDAERYHHVGGGSPYGMTMGAGWINELIARLTESPVQDDTTTNRTLDADEATFPLGGKRIFADFSHDNEMIEIITAMNIMPQRRALPLDSVPHKRTFQLSSIIPFGAKMVVERIGCDLGNWEPDPNAPADGKGEGGGESNGEDGKDDGGKGDGRKDYVRILVNDKVYAVDDVNCQQSGFVEHGMCEVELFVESQVWAREEVDWAVCRDGATRGDIV